MWSSRHSVVVKHNDRARARRTPHAGHAFCSSCVVTTPHNWRNDAGPSFLPSRAPRRTSMRPAGAPPIVMSKYTVDVTAASVGRCSGRNCLRKSNGPPICSDDAEDGRRPVMARGDARRAAPPRGAPERKPHAVAARLRMSVRRSIITASDVEGSARAGILNVHHQILDQILMTIVMILTFRAALSKGPIKD